MKSLIRRVSERLRKNRPEERVPPALPQSFLISHVEEDGPVRADGVKLAVLEVLGLEIDEPGIGAFAGALNACDFPVQFLVRQHPPRLAGLRRDLERAQPCGLPDKGLDAAESLRTMLESLEPATAYLIAGSTPSPNMDAPKHSEGFWQEPASPCTPSEVERSACSSLRPPWEERLRGSTAKNL